MKKLLSLFAALSITVMTCAPPVSAADEKKEIVFADVGWDSIELNNAIAGLIAEEIFGYTWSEVPGSTPITHEALINSEIDVNMEEWTNNITTYQEDLNAGKFTELGINFDDNYQGLYIPAYVAEKYPDLKNVKDLAKYPELFADPEDPDKGVIYGGIPGWEATEIMQKKINAYGLDEYYNYVVPGSTPALDSVITSAWDKKEPFVAYYWEPTWLMGKYDLVLLEDSPYDAATYKDGIGACPAVTVTIAVSNDFAQSNPEFCDFLSKYHTGSQLISEGLAYMQDNKADHSEAARWLLTQHPELAEEWLTPDQEKTLAASLGAGKGSEKTDWFSGFPLVHKPNTDAIDGAVRSFAVSAAPVLEKIQSLLGGMVNGFKWLLEHIPWFLFLILVFLAGWRVRRKLQSGILYAVILCLVGVVGFWDEMILTLSIVLASVVLALLFGLPVGILISNSPRANRIVRPILDTMQTMPVFVYLIPALLLFGLGNASAVIATVIYAIVPVIRLTSLGIRQVDTEVVEAARSFGSTRWQTLFKVQIPQAIPTIMTGVNQTLMMAMAMVVTCSMIGARGLGMEVLNAVNRTEIGRGLVAGGCVVILAVVLDRLTQGWFGREKKDTETRSEE
ncbi:glycine betaine ABC transporter substrate-binding protein [[Clostridium] hylemonae]|uniref:ABC transporter, substrate-binding protein, QAT family n=1 Tax=[Clostridium] hylemonae DSM 15053 TaxID=553973 RepID=C0C5K8_9FIRM|nr:glycine betaine ABC transporter substrate-binding protein [[Clostridium] hylemonae]EEG72392.1 ABC transporter, substrate-binding protein, QAT family [[Clostridium] hylemonae DSM 15053]QEK16571.1 Glycine betaine/proline betaine transport system permease protein ProW [[Clostridium] hylemonae DSM 15053]